LKIDLSGKWGYIIDENKTGIENRFFCRENNDGVINLPGSSCEAGIGKKAVYFDDMTKESVKSLIAAYEYKGVMWYRREIEIPPEFEGKRIFLYMERVMISSDIWLDDEKIGRTQFSMSTPHIYQLPFKSGKHMLSVRIDNSDILSLENMASGYTDDTQTIWNGIIGKIYIYTQDVYSVSNIDIYPDFDNSKIKASITIKSDLKSPSDRKNIKLKAKVSEYKGDFEYPPAEFEKTLYHSTQIVNIEYNMPDFKKWDEFKADLYIFKLEFECDEYKSEYSEIFGMRKIETDGRKILINGHQCFMRGTLDCCIYPETGYPPVSLEKWLDVFGTIKSYGLNHVRFHSWCPPENAFLAADIMGIYVLAEMPFWLNKDVCRIEAGDDSVHGLFFSAETERISRFYGNHPSFCMFSNGNELLGDFEMLYKITKKIKALDNRRLYTLTSNFDRPVTDADDYFSAFESDGKGIRLQYYPNKISENTYLDYSKEINVQDIPVISFEIGQYCVYPDIRETDRYNGNLLPVNFDSIKKHMEKKGVIHMIDEYVKASGKLAVLLYKEEIETALRTEDMGGFELLGLQDYPGQCTATIGILNSFGENKGFISPERFAEFAGAVVPIIKTKRMYKIGEIFEAEFVLKNFSGENFDNTVFVLQMYLNNKKVYEIETKEKRVSFKIDFTEKSSIAECVLSVKNTKYKNRMNIFIFEHTDKVKCDNCYNEVSDEVKDVIENGGKAIIFAKDKLKEDIDGSFFPVFWSPVYFPSGKPCGMICDTENGLYKNFPTEKYSDYQWYDILENSKSINISAFPKKFKPTVELVPNFFDNTRMAAAFECKVGKGDIFVCGFDENMESYQGRQMLYAINEYVNSDEFCPKDRIDENIFYDLFK